MCCQPCSVLTVFSGECSLGDCAPSAESGSQCYHLAGKCMDWTMVETNYLITDKTHSPSFLPSCPPSFPQTKWLEVGGGKMYITRNYLHLWFCFIEKKEQMVKHLYKILSDQIIDCKMLSFYTIWSHDDLTMTMGYRLESGNRDQ